MHLTQIQKVWTLANGALFASCGDSDDRAVRELLGKCTYNRLPSRLKLAALKADTDAIVVFPEAIYLIEIKFREEDEGGDWQGSVTALTDKMVALGTGMQFAYGAMEAGRGAAEAVRIACLRDTQSSLPVQTASLTKGHQYETQRHRRRTRTA